MPERPFHHGNLRTSLLDQAELVLRDRGVDALSLREIARNVGVSHGAPRTHFVDRAALLEALAERGFTRLTDSMQGAMDAHPTDFARALRASAHVYVDFAVTDAALLELMFAVKLDSPGSPVHAAFERFLLTVRDMVAHGRPSGEPTARDEAALERTSLLVSATMHGIGTFAASGLPKREVDHLIDDAVDGFLAR